jgi:hypothetical protein
MIETFWGKNTKADQKNEPNFYISLIRNFSHEEVPFTGPFKTLCRKHCIMICPLGAKK